MSIVKSTRLERSRKFQVNPGYVLYLENVSHEPGSVVLVSTAEALDVIMSQRWKVRELVPEPVAVPPVVEEVHEPEETIPEKPKEEPKAEVSQRFQRARRPR